MNNGYRAFLLGTATDLPCRGFTLTVHREGDALLAGMRKWNKVISSAEH